LQKEIAKVAISSDDATQAQIEREIDLAPVGSMESAVEGYAEDEMSPEDEMEDEMESEDEGFEVHIMMDPESGAMEIAKTEADHTRLAAQGWVHI